MIIHLEQGTSEWLEWRRTKITASDIPVLMGESDFSTPREVWKVKTKRAQEKESNFAMQRGTDTEPKVRALYALENDVDVPPVLAQHDCYPLFGASLDGYNAEFENGAGLIIEIKYPGKEKHQQAENGIVPECYRAQIQFQLECAKAKYCDYVSYNGVQIAVVRVTRNEEHIQRIIPVALEFMNFVATDTPPPLTARDFMEVSDLKFRVAFNEWKYLKLMQMQLEEIPEMKKELKEVNAKLEQTRGRIKEILPHPKIICDGVKCITVNRKSGPSLDIRFLEA